MIDCLGVVTPTVLQRVARAESNVTLARGKIRDVITTVHNSAVSGIGHRLRDHYSVTHSRMLLSFRIQILSIPMRRSNVEVIS